MKKKMVSCMALATAVAMLLAGCGGDGGNAQGSASAGAQAQSTGGGDSQGGAGGDRVPITIWIQDYDGLDYDNCLMTKTLEEKLNVDLQFENFSTANDANTQFNLSTTSGKYPDIYLSLWFSTNQVTSASQNGVLIPLDDYIVEGTNYKKALDENAGWEDMVRSADGHIYTFFYNDTGVHKASEYKMWYREDWLETLGWKEPPKTPEEFKQYLMDIKEKDANGNGDPSDEIPLMGYYNGRQTDPICFLMNPFELYTDKYYYITDSNEIHFSAVTDQWRKGLAYIADLYKEGLIDEATYVQDGDTFRPILNKDGAEAVVGVFPAWYNGAEINSSVMSWFTYEPLAPLKGDYQQSAARFGGSFVLNGAITTQCENPDVAFKVLDYLVGEEGSYLGMWGVEGETYEIVEGESYNGDAQSVKQTVDKLIPDYLWNSSAFPRYDTVEMRYAALKDDSVIESDNTYVLLHAAEVYEPYYVNHHIPDIVWCEDMDVVQAVNDYSAMINDYIKKMDTEFVMGRSDINDDAQWQAYLDELDRMGLQDYIEKLYTFYGLK